MYQLKLELRFVIAICISIALASSPLAQTPTSLDPKLLANMGRELTEAREWQLQDGTKLQGIATHSLNESWLCDEVVINDQSTFLQLVVPLDDFIPKQCSELVKLLAQDEPFWLKFGQSPMNVALMPWKGNAPQAPSNMLLWAFDSGRVIGKFGNSYYEIDPSLVDMEAVRKQQELLEQSNPGGRYSAITCEYFPSALSLRPLRSTNTEFIFECGPSMPCKTGRIVRAPKFIFSKRMQAAILGLEKLEVKGAAAELDAASIAKLPCLRRTFGNCILTDGPMSADFKTINMLVKKSVQPDAEDIFQIPLLPFYKTDLLNFLLNAQGIVLQQADFEDARRLRETAAPVIQDFLKLATQGDTSWIIEGCSSPQFGRVVAKVNNDVYFQRSGEPVFIARIDQFAPVDRLVIELTMTEKDGDAYLKTIGPQVPPRLIRGLGAATAVQSPFAEDKIPFYMTQQGNQERFMQLAVQDYKYVLGSKAPAKTLASNSSNVGRMPNAASPEASKKLPITPAPNTSAPMPLPAVSPSSKAPEPIHLLVAALGRYTSKTEFKLTNGQTVYGVPSAAIYSGHAVLNAMSGGYVPPNELHVPFGLFSPDDRLAILASFYYPNQYARYGFLDPFAKSIEGWKIGEPPMAAAIEKIVDMSNEKIIAISPEGLLEIDEKIVADEALAELRNAFKAAGSGQYMTIIEGNTKFAGKLIAQSSDDYVLEAGKNAAGMDSELKEGTRYRVPKYLLSPVLAKQFEAIYREVESRGWIQSMTPSDILDLPCYRSESGRGSICYPSDTVDQDILKAIRRNAQVDSVQAVGLNCADQFAQERDARLSLGMDRDKANTEALLSVAEMSGKRIGWMLRGAASQFSGKLVGTFEDGYVFNNNSFGPFFVMASQLAPVDAKVAAIASREFDKKWIEEVDWDKFLKNRLILSFGQWRIVHADGNMQVNSTIRGSIPVLKEVNGVDYGTAGWHLDSLLDLVKVSKQLKTFQNVEQVKARAKMPSTLPPNQNALATSSSPDAPNPTPSTGLPSLKAKPPKLEKERWQLIVENYDFTATLAGEFKDDFVFVDTIDGKQRSFLVGKALLVEKDRKRIEGLLARMPKVDWTDKLDRARDWQYYRIWYDQASKRIVDRSPLIISGILDGAIAFEYFDGGSTSLFLSTNENREKEKAPYIAALEEALGRKATAESKLESWELRESEAVVKAEYVSQTDDDVVLRDVDKVLCLFAKSNLKDDVRKEISARPRAQVGTEKLPRMWCGRGELYGPGTLERINQGSALVFRRPTGEADSAEWRSLTLREQLLAEAEWLRISKGLADDRSFDFVLEAQLTADEILKETPVLSSGLKKRIDDYGDWQIFEWEAFPINVDAQATAFAIDREATTVIAALPDKSCQVVDVATGTSNKLEGIDFSNLQFGPWLMEGSKGIWWIANGKLMSRSSAGVVASLTPAGSPDIIAASQTGDFESLVVLYANGAISKHNLTSGKGTVLSLESKSFKAASSPKIWASKTGSHVIMNDGHGMVAMQFEKDGKPVPKDVLLATKKNITLGAINSRVGLFLEEGDNNPTTMAFVDSDKDLLAYTGYGPKMFGFVGIDGVELFQFIGRPADKFYDRTNYYFAKQQEVAGVAGEIAHQIIVGEIDERSKLAGNGAAIVHTRDGKVVVSKRPQTLSRNLNTLLTKIARELVEQRDIGQLEALSRYLEQSQFAELRTYRNQIADDFQTLILAACQDHLAHVSGDRLNRMHRLAEHLLAKFPNSQVARNVIVGLYIREAWDARGSGYAGRVTDVGWEIFNSSMEKAKRHVDALLSAPRPMAVSYNSAIDIAMATSASLESVQGLANAILKGDHAENAELHNSIALLLLPRWHGEPGMTEAYLENVAKRIGGNAGDVVYAKAVTSLSGISSGQVPVTAELNLNVERIVNGTKSFYETRTDPDLIEGMITLLSLKTKKPQVRELFQLRADKRLPPGATSRKYPAEFQSVLENSRFLRMAK